MHLCTVGIVVPEMLGARYLIILALAISTKSQEEEPSIFLLPLLYSYGTCDAVPYPQTLTAYFTTHQSLNSTKIAIYAFGKTTTGALWKIKQLVVNSVFEVPLITLYHEAPVRHFCLNYYCDEQPSLQIRNQSNGVCTQKSGNSGLYVSSENDPTISFIISNKGPNFMNIYAVLPISTIQQDFKYYILNPSQYLEEYTQALAIRAYLNHTEVSITPTSPIRIFHPNDLPEINFDYVEANSRAVLYFKAYETVWIEPVVEKCDSTVTLTGTLIESSHDIAVFSSQALCNKSSNSTTDYAIGSGTGSNFVTATTSKLPFSFIVNHLHQLPPVRRWGTHFVSDLFKLNLFPPAEMDYFIISFSAMSDRKSEVSIKCYKHGETICSGRQHLSNGTVWRYELQMKEMLLADAIIIKSNHPILVLHETYSKSKDRVFYSELLQPTEWFSRQQVIPISHSLVSLSQAFIISLVIPNEYFTLQEINIWDNRGNETPLVLDDYELISSYSHSRVEDNTLVHITVDPMGYNSSDFVLKFAINNTNNCTRFGASILSLGEYAYSNGYIGEKRMTCKKEIKINIVAMALGITAGLLVAMVTAILVALFYKKYLSEPPPPPNKGFEYDIFLSFADEDREFAQKILLEPLREKCYEVLLHFTDFIAGMTIEDNIIRAVKISRVVLYVCSQNFTKSTFCQSELKYGLESHYGAYKGQYRRLVPIVIDGECPTELNTFRMRPIKASGSVDSYDKNAINKLLKTLKLGKPIQPNTTDMELTQGNGFHLI